METVNQIHKYLIAAAMFAAFFHFAYLMIKAMKKSHMAEMEDATFNELKKSGKRFLDNPKKYLGIYLKPFLVILLWILCISVYSITVIKLGLIW